MLLPVRCATGHARKTLLLRMLVLPACLPYLGAFRKFPDSGYNSSTIICLSLHFKAAHHRQVLHDYIVSVFTKVNIASLMTK